MGIAPARAGGEGVSDEAVGRAPPRLAGKGECLPDTVLSRAVVVRMRRRAPNERVEPFRRRVAAAAGHALRDRLAAWAAGVAPRLTAWPAMPDGVVDRQADVWEPFIAVADAAGGQWPELARVTAVTVVRDTRGRAEDASMGVRLLSDLHKIFEGYDVRSTETLLKELHACPESPWAEVRGKPLTDRGLADRLRPFGVRPKVVRLGSTTARGYTRADLWDAWTRYLPSADTQQT